LYFGSDSGEREDVKDKLKDIWKDLHEKGELKV
jgi:hypothetical protein